MFRNNSALPVTRKRPTPHEESGWAWEVVRVKPIVSLILTLALVLSASAASAQSTTVEPGGRDYAIIGGSTTKGPFYYQSENELRARKLARGVANVCLAVGEVPNQMFQEAYSTSPITGSVVGLGKGVVKGAKRLVFGVWEVATFFVPGSRDYEPYVEPEVVFQEYLY